MTKSDEKAIGALNKLTEICKDGQNGFSEAADAIANPVIKSELLVFAGQRGEFAGQLQQQVRALGGKSEKSGSAAGAMHRGWIDLRAAISGHDEYAVLAECERGEDVAKHTYEEILNGRDLPATLVPQVERQYGQIKIVHDRVRELRDSYAPASIR